MELPLWLRCPSGSAVPVAPLCRDALHLPQAFTTGWEPLRGTLCSEPVSDKRGGRVAAKGTGSVHYPCQPLCPPAGHSRLAGASRAHRWGWQLGFHGRFRPALVLSLHQAAPKYCPCLGSTVAVALTESGLPAPYAPSPSCRAALGCECYSQNTPRATAPKTASEWLLPGSQSLRVLLTLAQCCPCGASLGCLGARRVLGSSILSPPLLPSWEMEPMMPTPWRCQHLGSASTSAVPAALPTPAQDCTGSLSPKRARVGEEGEAPWGRQDPGTACSPSG